MINQPSIRIIFILLVVSFSYYLIHTNSNVDAFSMQVRHRLTYSSRCTTTSSSSYILLYGLLDDVMNETNENNSNNNDSNYEDLFFALIMSQDAKTDIASQIEKYTDPNFMNYLHTSIEQSNDEEEIHGLKDLIDLINQVKINVEKKEQTLEEERQKKEAIKFQKGEENEKKNSESMSNADVLKQAFAIDKAGSTASPDDSEKPSDFMSDCREVVNLSRGFNNQGQMRVGGR